MNIFGKRKTAAVTEPADVDQTQEVGKANLSKPMVSLVKQAAASLQNEGLTGHRASVRLVMDHSGSMRPYYQDGSMQRLAEQALGLSVNLDDDSLVPLTYFGTDAYPSTIVHLDQYAGVINRTHERIRWGSTNYAAAIDYVVEEHGDDPRPSLVIFQTDGDPDSRQRAEDALRKASNAPVFFAFVGFGHQVQFLRRLDLLTGRRVDNASFFHAVDPMRTSDEALYDAITGEYAKWLVAARAAGVLR